MKHAVHDVTEAASDKPLRQSVSLAIRSPDHPGDVLIVRRPDDDDDLPGAWGLPAASLRGGEDWMAAAERAAREKLGVPIAIQGEVNRGRIERREYVLEMVLFKATLGDGVPMVPQPHEHVTQYTDWRWGRSEDLVPAAEKGSLCSRLYLASDTGR